MTELFLKIVNMSISASWLILAVLLLRLVFRKAPKWVNVLLWGIVAVCFLTDPATPDYDFTDDSIASAGAMDFRSTTDSGGPMLRTLNMAEIQELESRLEDLSGMRSSGDMGGFTPFYSLDIHLEDGTALKFDGYSGTEHRVYTEYEGKTLRITDTEFCEYLSRICAGGTVSAAEMQTMEERPASEEDMPPNRNSDESFEPYLLRISRADLQIFDGPGYDAVYVGAIGAAGTYTIVEEQTDEEGNRWGKLKSGVGWIDLTKAQTGNTAPIAVVFANDDLLSGKDHHEYLADDSEYAVKLLFTANDVLTDVRFSSLRYENGTFAIAEELDSISELKPEEPYVAGVVFYGDMTTYGISFTDSAGNVHHFAVYISGRNGALMLEEYVS